MTGAASSGGGCGEQSHLRSWSRAALGHSAAQPMVGAKYVAARVRHESARHIYCTDATGLFRHPSRRAAQQPYTAGPETAHGMR
jgi:nitrogen fixation protein FixH